MAATLIVSVEDAEVGFELNVPVIPAGQLDVASVTEELKPLTAVIVTADAPLVPATTVAAVALKL